MSSRFVEAPVVFGRDQSLIGVTCTPTESSGHGRPFVIFINAGIVHRTGPNRIYVKLARRLAEAGFRSLRFDLSGIGDSVRPGSARAMSIQERAERDIEDALDFGRSKGEAGAFVLIGLCSGADNALRRMGRDPRVVGSVLLDMNAPRTLGFYVRRYARRIVRPDWWKSTFAGRNGLHRRLWRRLRGARDGGGRDEVPEVPELWPDAWLPRDLMRDHLERIVARDGRLLCIFTPGLDAYNHREQFLHVFPDLDFRGCLRLEYFADSDHTFSREFLQRRLIDTVVEWMTEAEFPDAPEDTHQGEDRDAAQARLGRGSPSTS